ncbi:hypothetical protein [Desulfitobacterium sp.]|uniref:hypothetical protein n=1 Tax=Desulfitobacterium sp. TaxID=49981 RepID=UPI002C501CDC|nr:hypothetical protein [Desulfitobacterium sp.]HVJ48971.1 hypothetical protein [Desulfitobacterium sp.]
MRKKKDGLTVREAKQQLRDCAAGIQPKQLVVKNFWQVTLASFVVGMISADSVKTRESLVSLAVSALKKII